MAPSPPWNKLSGDAYVMKNANTQGEGVHHRDWSARVQPVPVSQASKYKRKDKSKLGRCNTGSLDKNVFKESKAI